MATVQVLSPASIRSFTVKVPISVLQDARIAIMPNDRILLAGQRCPWSATYIPSNGYIYSFSGELIAEGVLGDGLRHVRVDSEGSIWTAYSDEGIFGNFGWGNPGPEPIGQPGLARFGDDFDMKWHMPAIDPSVYDFEVVNLWNDELWGSYFSDYPIIRVRGEIVEVSQGNIPAWFTPRHLLVDSSHVALLNSSHMVTMQIARDRFEVEEVFALPDEFSRPMTHGTAHAKGPNLDLITNAGQWLQTTLDDIVIACRHA